MEQFEFSVSTDLQAMQPKEIVCNYEETAKWLDMVLAPYQGLIVEEDAVGAAKKDLAQIRKVKAAIEETRKSVKREFTAPLTAFEEKVKKLTDKCDKAAENIDKQVKNYTQRKAEEKIAEIRAFFDENAAGVSSYLKWEDLFNLRWANATYAKEDAEKEIEDRICATIEDLNSIRELHSEFETELIAEYARSHDLRAVLKHNTELSNIKNAENAARERQTINRDEGAQGVTKNEATEPQEAPSNKSQCLMTYQLEVTGTNAQLRALNAWMKQNGIQFISLGRVQ